MEIVNKYANGKIYKIVDNGYNEAYYGSTCSKLSTRMASHRCSYRRFLLGIYGKSSLYDIFQKYGISNCKIELVKLFPCASNIELTAEEGSYIKGNACVNKYIAGNISSLGQQEYIKEWRNNNKEYIKEYQQTNKDKIQEKHNEWLINNKERVQEYKKTRMLKIITDNPQYYKDYYAANKEKYIERNLARKKIFVHCDICDCDLVQKSYICHIQTPKHLNNILLKNI